MDAPVLNTMSMNGETAKLSRAVCEELSKSASEKQDDNDEVEVKNKQDARATIRAARCFSAGSARQALSAVFMPRLGRDDCDCWTFSAPIP